MKNKTEHIDFDQSKEINKINENNLILSPIINDNLTKSDNLSKKSDWKLLKDYSYHFIYNIDELWEIIKSLMNNSKNELITIKKTSIILRIGNIYEGKILDIFEFKAKINKLKLFSEKKLIEWIFNIDNREDFKIKIILYKVTEDNSTIIFLKTKFIYLYGDNAIFKIKRKIDGNIFFKNIEKIIKNKCIYLSQYESGILLGNLEEIWDIITDNSKLVLIAPNNKCFVPFNINKVKIGGISLINLRINNVDGYLEIQLDSKENKPNWNEWSFSYSIIGGEPFKIVKQTVLVQLIKINKYETQLSIYTKIYGKITKEMLKNLSDKKKYVISSLKDYFENFSTPMNSILE